MKIVTTTREYDAEGRLVKETVMESETPDAPAPVYLPTCTCGSTSGYCPTHGYRGRWQTPWTCGVYGSTTTAPMIYSNEAALS